MVLALIYDFDGTLSPGNMQEYDFIPAIGKDNREFWDACNRMALENDADPILTYMNEMIRQAKANGVSLKRSAFAESGSKVQLFEGVESWFGRINRYGNSRGVQIEHYINSSGLKEMIEGTSIARHFKKIFLKAGNSVDRENLRRPNKNAPFRKSILFRKGYFCVICSFIIAKKSPMCNAFSASVFCPEMYTFSDGNCVFHLPSYTYQGGTHLCTQKSF